MKLPPTQSRYNFHVEPKLTYYYFAPLFFLFFFFLFNIHYQCVDINIPDGDDTHLLFIPLNLDITDIAEDWYVTQLSEITRHESKQFLKELDTTQPPEVKENAKQTKHSRSISKISATVEAVAKHPRTSKQFTLNYFQLTKYQNVAEDLTKSTGKWDDARGQFEMCFSTRGKSDVKILFDSVKISEYVEKYNKRHVLRKEHLSPLEEAFESGISIAHSVLDEMRYMEKREIRMKQTTDGTNSRIRYFSYLSIVILLGVTYVQISYLKNYFKKKKVL